MQQKDISPAAWAQLFLLALIWGGSFLAIKIAVQELAPLTSVLHRTFWAMLALWAVVLIARLPVPRGGRVWGAFLVMGVLNNVIPFTLLAFGTKHLETGLVSIFNASTAVFGVLIAAIVFADEKLTPRKATGVFLGFLGVATAMGLEFLGQIDLRSTAQLACIGAALCYGCAGSWARAKLGGLPPMVAAAGMLTGATLVLIPLVLIFDGVPRFDLMPATWAAVAYYALIATASAFLLYYSILAKAGSGNLMLVTLLVAPVAILLGAVVLGEALHLREYLGFGLIACGLAVLPGLAREDIGSFSPTLWLLDAHGTCYPYGADRVLEYKGVLRQNGAARTTYGSVISALCFLEEAAGGVAQADRLSAEESQDSSLARCDQAPASLLRLLAFFER